MQDMQSGALAPADGGGCADAGRGSQMMNIARCLAETLVAHSTRSMASKESEMRRSARVPKKDEPVVANVVSRCLPDPFLSMSAFPRRVLRVAFHYAREGGKGPAEMYQHFGCTTVTPEEERNER